MADPILHIDKSSKKTLQAQIREKLVEGILNGTFPAGMKMPSSRRLSEQLSIARNTVTLVYQQLVTDGFLENRERSGFYVAEDAGQSEILDHRKQLSGNAVDQSLADIRPDEVGRAGSFPYAFISDLVDSELFPLSAWRECHRQVMGRSEISDWGRLAGYFVDLSLIDQIRTKILPQRGIIADADEILITNGYRAGLSLLTQQAVTSNLLVGLQDPIEHRTRSSIREAGARYRPLSDLSFDALRKIDVLCVASQLRWPDLQTPNLSEKKELVERARRAQCIIWESDPPKSYWSKEAGEPALRSLPYTESFVYLSALCPVAMAGQNIGFVVGPRDLIRDLRRRQEALGQVPPPFIQRAGALFLASGAYESASRKISQRFDEKWVEMSEALSFHLPQCNVTRAPQARSFWIQGPQDLNVVEFANMLEARGVLLEPSTRFYHEPREAEGHAFHLSIQAIPFRLIEEGVDILAKTMLESLSGKLESIDDVAADVLSSEQIVPRMAGLKFLGRNPLGEPYEITLHDDGSMSGVANRDTPDVEFDQGRWWTNEDLWFRQWDNWNFGRKAAFRIAIQGRVIKWIRPNGTILHSAIILDESR